MKRKKKLPHASLVLRTFHLTDQKTRDHIFLSCEFIFLAYEDLCLPIYLQINTDEKEA